MPMQGSFDANQYAPNQGGDAHPVGKFQAQISNTTIKPTKANLNKEPGCENDGMLAIEFTTQAGTITDNFQLWNKNEKTVEIARGNLSALCHCTGIYRLAFENDAAVLRGAFCMIEVAPQFDKVTKQPNGYVEVKKFYDKNGNEPGKAPAQQSMQQPQPNAAQAGWGNNNQASATQNNSGWGNQGGQPNNAPAANTAPAGWQQGNNPPAEKPPWAK